MKQIKTSSRNTTKLMRAIELLQKLHKEGKSDDTIAGMLQSKGIGPYDRATICRWRRHDPNSGGSSRMENRIIAAADVLANLTQSPITSIFGVIKNSTEMLPVHLLTEYRDWQTTCGVLVVTESVKHISEAMNALEQGDIDVAVAPRFSNVSITSTNKLKYKSVRRFFEIARFDVCGLFPFESHGQADLISNIENMIKSGGLMAGCLPNANYDHCLREFLAPHHIPNVPTTEVFDSTSAAEMLIDNRINAAVGHRAFVKNCLAKVGNHLPQTSGLKRSRLEKLKLAQSIIGQVTMDVFVNTTKISSPVARRTLAILSMSVEYMLKNKTTPALIETVNKVLGFEETGDGNISSGEDILKEYDFGIRSIDKDVLLSLWRA